MLAQLTISGPSPDTSISPRLLSLKQRFPQAWLWKACTEWLDCCRGWLDTREKLDLLQYALMDPGSGGAPTYPTRPSQPLQISRSVVALRSVLARAARAPDLDYARTPPGMESYEDFKGFISWHWTVKYEDEVQRALMKVIKEHGLGEAGWQTARWEVYDTVSPIECTRISTPS